MLVRVKGARAPSSHAGFAALDPACARSLNRYAGEGQTDASGGGSRLQMCLKFVDSQPNETLDIEDTVNAMWSL